MYEEAITIIVFFAALLAVYFMLFALVSSALVVGAETRRNAVEAALPDFLTLVSANVKAGMTLDQAMWYAAKPEFGLLSTEVKVVIKRAFSGESLSSALDDLAVRVDSKVFQRTISLIKQASATGGEIAEILERTAQDTRNSSIMKKDISASLVLYEIFVLFAAIFGTPFLFAVSSKLIGVLEKAFAYLPATGSQSVSQFSFIKPMVPTITSGQFFWFSIVTIAVTAVFASFIVGVIRTGSRTEGLKYLPFVMALALGVFWVVTQALNAFFITLT
jgi:type II secretory pathway component PulF